MKILPDGCLSKLIAGRKISRKDKCTLLAFALKNALLFLLGERTTIEMDPFAHALNRIGRTVKSCGKRVQI